MVDERLAALASLAPVRRVGHVVGVGDQLLRPLGSVGRDLLDKRRYCYARRRYSLRAFLCTNGFHSEIIPVRLQASGIRCCMEHQARTVAHPREIFAQPDTGSLNSIAFLT